MIFGFELPILSQNVDAASSYIVQIQEQYKVQVMFRRRPKLHATLVMVKGVEWEVIQVQRATLLLMEYMCGNLAVSIPESQVYYSPESLRSGKTICSTIG